MPRLLVRSMRDTRPASSRSDKARSTKPREMPALFTKKATVQLSPILKHLQRQAVVLLGAELAFSLQNARNHSFFHVSSISFRERKYVALRIMNCLCKCFKMGESCTVAFLVNSAGISRGLVLRALSDLEEAGLVSRMLRTKSRGMQYQPALDLQLISIKLVIDKLEMVGFTDAIRRFNTREDLRLQSILATNKEEDMDMLITDI